jgi:hypothetical protein
VAWTGGGAFGTTVRTAPASMRAFRPEDFKSMKSIEDDCRKGLTEAQQLPSQEGESKGITLTSWIGIIQRELEERGMDSVFRVMVGTTEVYMLTHWGNVTKQNVTVVNQTLVNRTVIETIISRQVLPQSQCHLRQLLPNAPSQ